MPSILWSCISSDEQVQLPLREHEWRPETQQLEFQLLTIGAKLLAAQLLASQLRIRFGSNSVACATRNNAEGFPPKTMVGVTTAGLALPRSQFH